MLTTLEKELIALRGSGYTLQQIAGRLKIPLAVVTQSGQEAMQKIRATVPWYKLKPDQKFRRMWDEHGYSESDLATEFQFDRERKWRFDFCWPSCKVAVEIHGFGFGHQAQQCLAQDCEKLRDAVRLGWVVLPFTTRCISTKAKCEAAVAEVCLLLSERFDG